MKKRSEELYPFSNLINGRSFSRLLPVVICILFATSSFSQDSTKTSSAKKTTPVAVKKHFHSPKKAMIFSACLPGLGQVYNKKYWKVPIIYAAFGTTLYFADYNNKFYHKYRTAYINKDYTIDGSNPPYTDASLRVMLDSYHKNRDLFIIITGLVYTLNVVDAYVDAHLTTFDVSDNLSMTVFPSINLQAARNNPSMGLTVALRF
ncbi:MAG TPA: DUF5683 domain-containing protein [Bacteroidia bacterium]